ncbi:hypothetical protein MUK42_34414 [Musa troglodytarum]|uniref:H(+)-transporting two-sector ATPase n=1 Tax=Musa troglodytarum TaxID=320322 RepID=A0A9E7EGF2_9LILI|nr:hypothetical protein MUK42_34414 [Musa troglodytarum]
MDELSEDDKLTVARARKIQQFLSQPFHVAGVFTGVPGKYIELKESVNSFQHPKTFANWVLWMGSIDDLPEQSVYMVGGIEEVIAKGISMNEQTPPPQGQGYFRSMLFHRTRVSASVILRALSQVYRRSTIRWRLLYGSDV